LDTEDGENLIYYLMRRKYHGAGRIFGPKNSRRVEKISYNEQLPNLYFSPNIFRLIMSRRMR
jgi:hypothetical protein